ncbi:uncharacterized protein BJ171DRAFT_583635 [Polychytrium aggregatum]|uniref:uncharacterized protein n=1 Tax=Polychytrium aggregatum TaxID=110093 RepID=UPI0022FE974D|nr:uncharacterized protein BJ171DRAFT_583635 [Polychytrium aggregatum]KAI9202820.1 hypothetical protein BJ171DRAFT_583635 [Polychytrium aggregatum]
MASFGNRRRGGPADGLTVPRGWPAGAQFIARSRWSPSVPGFLKTGWPFCYSASVDGQSDPPGFDAKEEGELIKYAGEDMDGPHPRVEIRKIDDAGHPIHAQNGYGLFAAHDLPPHSFVMDYVGELYVEEDDDSDNDGGAAARPHSDYDLHLFGMYSIDAKDAGNEARFINDFRGIACRPNVCFDAYRDTASGNLRMGCWVLGEPVRAGDELVVSYGSPWWRSRGMAVAGHGWDPDWD